MRELTLKNQKLISLLSNITDVFFSEQYSNILDRIKPIEDSLIPGIHACSEEYLNRAFELKIEDFSFPRSWFGLNRIQLESINYDCYEKIVAEVQKISSFLGTPLNALAMCYPDNGYIGWHHNGNASGYNILITYSQDADGHFSYWDYNTQSIVRYQDKTGWNLKAGYYPSMKKNANNVFWHMAETKQKRITIAWVLNHKEMWKNAIEELTEGDYDTSIFDQ